jgi:hypothetical protein
MRSIYATDTQAQSTLVVRVICRRRRRRRTTARRRGSSRCRTATRQLLKPQLSTWRDGRVCVCGCVCVCVCVCVGGGQLKKSSRAGELAIAVACVDALTRSRGDATRNVSLYARGHEKSSLRYGVLTTWARGVDSTSHLARHLPAHHSPCARGAPPHPCQTSTGDDCPQSHTAASQRAPLRRQESTPMHSACTRTQRVAHRCLEQSRAQRVGERGWRHTHHLEVVEDLGVHTILVRQPRQRSNDILDNKLVHVYLGSGMWGKR